MKKLVLLGILIGLFIGAEAQSNLTVNIKGIDEPKGDLYIALYDANVPFLSSKAISGKIVKINDKSVDVTFEGLNDGEHAIAIYQDENSNAKLDLGEWGIPMEKYGFSNNIDPASLRRPPVFDECKFEVKGNTTITINLVSAIK